MDTGYLQNTQGNNDPYGMARYLGGAGTPAPTGQTATQVAMMGGPLSTQKFNGPGMGGNAGNSAYGALGNQHAMNWKGFAGGGGAPGSQWMSQDQMRDKYLGYNSAHDPRMQTSFNGYGPNPNQQFRSSGPMPMQSQQQSQQNAMNQYWSARNSMHGR